MEPTAPLLVIDRVKTDPDRIAADLRIGGRSARVELDLSVPGLIAFEQMPEVLEVHAPARQAVIDCLARIHRNEALSLPIDLSEVVRGASEPWPLRAPSDAALPAASRTVQITRVETDTPGRGLTTVHLDVASAAATIVVDRSDGPERPVRFQFAEGVHPWQLSSADANAMLVALLAAVCRA